MLTGRSGRARRDMSRREGLPRLRFGNRDGEATMKVFVAGATGAVGTRLVPRLVERGHDVVGSTRSPDKAARLRAQGAEAVVLDLLDARAVREALETARPDAIVHEATALSGPADMRRFDRTFAL